MIKTLMFMMVINSSTPYVPTDVQYYPDYSQPETEWDTLIFHACSDYGHKRWKQRGGLNDPKEKARWLYDTSQCLKSYGYKDHKRIDVKF